MACGGAFLPLLDPTLWRESERDWPDNLTEPDRFSSCRRASEDFRAAVVHGCGQPTGCVDSARIRSFATGCLPKLPESSGNCSTEGWSQPRASTRGNEFCGVATGRRVSQGLSARGG